MAYKFQIHNNSVSSALVYNDQSVSTRSNIFTGGIIFGKLSDIYGRRTVLTFTVAVICLFSSLSALTNNKWQFLFLRCFVGLCTGMSYKILVHHFKSVKF